MLYLDSNIRLTDIFDGSSNTVMVGERPPSQNGWFGRWHGGWGYWRVGDSILGVRETALNPITGCGAGPNHFAYDRPSNPCASFHFWSLHPGGGHFLFADGGVKFLPYTADPILPMLATRSGGEAVSLDR
jgi:prepilin-type processing-associated H-X9-DG protein